eukprot:scaffold991_cov278-Amphora_coffeaeformis.AAC.7
MSSGTTTPPRAITGCVGKRIRVILGPTGQDYLVLLNHDDGVRPWQEADWSGDIPGPVARQINNCTNKGRYITQVDFNTSTGAWFVSGVKCDGSGGHSWWGGTDNGDAISESASARDCTKVSFGSCDYNSEMFCVITGNNGFAHQNIPKSLLNRMNRINKLKKSIHFIRLFEHFQYFIKDDEGTKWRVSGTHLGRELKKLGGNVSDVALAEDGSWLIVGHNSYSASTGVSKDLCSSLDDFYRKQQSRNSKRGNEIRLFHARNRELEEEAARIREQRAEAIRIEQETLRLQREEAIRRQLQDEDRRLREEQARMEREEAQKEAELIEEADSIHRLQEHINNRKWALLDAADSLSPDKRNRVQERSSELAIIPCGHVCLCSECSQESQQHNVGVVERCPICRNQTDLHTLWRVISGIICYKIHYWSTHT